MATTFPSVAQGASYSVFVQHYGGRPPYSWTVSAGALPTGLTLSGGFVAGTVDGACTTGVWPFTVRFTDGQGRYSEKAFDITVTEAPSLFVACYGNKVRKYSSAGTYLGEVDVETGNGAGIVWDGSSIWVASAANPADIERYDPATRARTGGPYTPGGYLLGHYATTGTMVFDGTNYWVCKAGGEVKVFNSSGTLVQTVSGLNDVQWMAYDGGDYILAPVRFGDHVHRIHRSTYAITPSAGLNVGVGGGIGAPGVVVSGYYYQSYYRAPSPWAGYLAKIRISDMAIMWENAMGFNYPENACCTDGTYIYTARGSLYIAKNQLSDGAYVTSTPSLGNNPYNCAYESGYVWATCTAGSNIKRITPATMSYADIAAPVTCVGICSTGHTLPLVP